MFARIGMMVAALFAATQAPAAAPPERARAWVEMAPGGGSIVRVLTSAASCPSLRVDGMAAPMHERAAPAVLPPRANKAGEGAAVAFPARVCERAL
ncbi:MAG: hypothetical protein KGK11_11380, partial [Sphingomonadales bacterium]|nr:hypothetical protein [Sphingomonadales bacterium]